MKQFNLEEYLENPDRRIITKDGRSVRIICTNKLDNNYPVVALVHDGDCEKCYSYTKFGKLYTYQNRDCELDLFFAPIKKERWVNMYKTRSGATQIGQIYSSKEEAEMGRKDADYISTAKIEWEE